MSEKTKMIKCVHKGCSLITEDGYCFSTNTIMCKKIPPQFDDDYVYGD